MEVREQLIRVVVITRKNDSNLPAILKSTPLDHSGTLAFDVLACLGCQEWGSNP